MLSFTQHEAICEQTTQNKHLDHVEDLMILRGATGLATSIAFLKDIIQSLKMGASDMGMSTKWDGKPAIICGVNPENQRLFVAIKGVFGRESKFFHTEKEIHDFIQIPDLANKLATVLKYLPKLGITGVLQGDLMFTQDSKVTVEIHGKQHIGFQPNAIFYAVPVADELGKKIAAAKVGIVFHTEYSGDTLSALSATSFNYDSSKLKKDPDVWVTDPNIYDLTPAMISPEIAANLLKDLADCEALATRVSPFLPTLLARKDLMPLLLPYINSTINGGLTNFSASGLKLNVKTKLEREINKLKSEKGQESKTESMGKILNFVDAYQAQFTEMFALHNMIAKVKEATLGRLYAVSQLGHFFVDEDGIRPTNPEGIVIVRNGTVVKLVNRLRFSRQNRKVNKG